MPITAIQFVRSKSYTFICTACNFISCKLNQRQDRPADLKKIKRTGRKAFRYPQRYYTLEAQMTCRKGHESTLWGHFLQTQDQELTHINHCSFLSSCPDQLNHSSAQKRITVKKLSSDFIHMEVTGPYLSTCLEFIGLSFRE